MISEYLNRAIELNRLAHALLFVGENSDQKKHAALELAARLNCDPFHIRSIESESSEIKIDTIRQLNQEQRMQSAPGQTQVWIIIDAHHLTPQAANALLKTLEEPQEGQIIILLAPSIRSVLPTIVSRCQRLIFHSQETEKHSNEIEQLIQKIGSAKINARILIIETLAKQSDTLEQTLMHMQRQLMHHKNLVAIGAIEKALQSLKANGNTQLVLEELLLKNWPAA